MRQESLLDAVSNEATDEVIFLVLPWPPSANHYQRQMVMLPKKDEVRAAATGTWDADDYYGFFRKKSRVMSFPTNETKEFESLVRSIVVRARAMKLWDCPCVISMWVHPPDRRRRDLSNLWKMVEDALVKAKVVRDDSLFVEHHDYKLDVARHGSVSIEIKKRPD